jgi:hypothetical protein
MTALHDTTPLFLSEKRLQVKELAPDFSDKKYTMYFCALRDALLVIKDGTLTAFRRISGNASIIGSLSP